jgi:hypothetical protein
MEPEPSGCHRVGQRRQVLKLIICNQSVYKACFSFRDSHKNILSTLIQMQYGTLGRDRTWSSVGRRSDCSFDASRDELDRGRSGRIFRVKTARFGLRPFLKKTNQKISNRDRVFKIDIVEKTVNR